MVQEKLGWSKLSVTIRESFFTYHSPRSTASCTGVVVTALWPGHPCPKLLVALLGWLASQGHFAPWLHLLFRSMHWLHFTLLCINIYCSLPLKHQRQNEKQISRSPWLFVERKINLFLPPANPHMMFSKPLMIFINFLWTEKWTDSAQCFILWPQLNILATQEGGYSPHHIDENSGQRN